MTMTQTLLNASIYSHPALLQAAALPITPTQYLPLAFVIVLTVILCAAIVYMLAGVINSDQAKGWAKFQIYEALLSMFLLVIFSSITYIFFLNPQTTFSSVKLVPTPCVSASQVFTLATCDLALFDNASYGMVRTLYYVSFFSSVLFGVVPDVDVQPLGQFAGVKFEFGSKQGTFVGFLITIMGYVDFAMILALAANQLQLIVLAGAVLFLGFFVSLGLVVRTLGFTRTFGGAMIAFGLGLGIVYPLLVTITYGYIDVVANVACLQTISCTSSTAVAALFTLLFGGGTLAAGLGSFFITFGYILIGLTLVPILNFVIVDAFIIDFSRAIGEKMSFSSLFANLI
jgi:hypothetical protein